MLSSRKFFAIVVSVILIALVTLFTFLNIVNLFQAPLESIPFDGGWLGFLFIFANGFLLSLILDQNRIGIIERLLLSIGLGFGLTFTAMILIGVFWEFSFFTVLFTQVFLLITLSATAIFRGFHVKRNHFPSSEINDVKATWSKINVLSIAIIGVLIVFALYKTISLPAIEWDSLAYGVNYAKIIFQNGNIPIIAGPSIGLEMSASYPPGIQLAAVSLYTLAGTANDFYYRLLSPIFGIATMLVTYKFALLLNKNRAHSIYAVSVLCIVPFFWEIFIQETYLMALILMLLLSAFFFFKAYNSNSSDAKKNETIGILFCGFAALTSYTGLFSLGILLLYGLNKKVNLKRIVWLIALAAIIILPWYVRNFILLGNPIYPFLGIGKYLDPLLRSSTMQHFQQYSLLPYYGLAYVLCILGVGVLIAAIIYLSFSKHRDFRFVLPYYLLFIFLTIMVLHVIFPRYLILALPALVILFSTTIKSIYLPKSHRLKTVIPGVLLSLVIVSSVLMLPYMNTIKPDRQLDEDKSHYLSRVFEEGDAWQWINEKTPENARIATFDIKEYYLKRDILPLDGNESAPLYRMETIEECIDFLQERGVSYVLSVPWASLGDVRMPPAYLWCPLTSYLGDDDYLPTVFIGRNGTAIYHIGPLDENPIYQALAEKNMTFPIKHITLNLTITNNTYPYVYQFYLPIPVDYRNGTMTVFINSSKPLVVELWGGLISADEIIERSANSEPIIKWPIKPGNSSSIKSPSFTWQPIDKAGYFTFRILDEETSLKNEFNVTVNMRFYNYFGN